MNAPAKHCGPTVRIRERGGLLLELPGVELKSEANERGHSIARSRRVAEQRAAVESTLRTMGGAPPVLPAVVCITRVAPRALDSDNLASACKAVRDAVALWLVPVEQVVRTGALRGTVRTVGDDRDARVEWRTAQDEGPHGVRIEIAPTRPRDPSQPFAGAQHRGVETVVDLVLGPRAIALVALQLREVAAGERDACVVRVGLTTLRIGRTGGT